MKSSSLILPDERQPIDRRAFLRRTVGMGVAGAALLAANAAEAVSSVKQADVASGSFTLSLNSLASDSNLLAGRQSTAIVNSSNEYLDYIISGKIKTGTTPTANKTLEVWLYGATDDTPTYPDQLTGTDGNVTMTTRDILATSCSLLMTFTPATTTGQVIWMRPTGIAQFFGGVVPTSFGIFVVHSMVAALDASAGGTFKYSPRYATVG